MMFNPGNRLLIVNGEGCYNCKGKLELPLLYCPTLRKVFHRDCYVCPKVVCLNSKTLNEDGCNLGHMRGHAESIARRYGQHEDWAVNKLEVEK